MSFKDTIFSVKQTLNCGGTLLDFNQPRIMGILNITPDSFYDGGKNSSVPEILRHVEEMLTEGADIVDVGPWSSHPGSKEITIDEERNRLKPALTAIRSHFPDMLLSVDTFRADIAKYAVLEFGVNMINDISGGMMDNEMLKVAGSLKVPYVLMHMQGTPGNMQKAPQYTDVVKELLAFFAQRIVAAKNEGIQDIIIDPGFGFGKTVEHNYTLLRELRLFEILGYPLMVGISRKSMIYRPLGLSAEEALNGSTALNALALSNGANLLRVHDVKEAVQTIKLLRLFQGRGLD